MQHGPLGKFLVRLSSTGSNALYSNDMLGALTADATAIQCMFGSGLSRLEPTSTDALAVQELDKKTCGAIRNSARVLEVPRPTNILNSAGLGRSTK